MSTEKVPSVLMWVGEESYSLADFIDEAEFLGVSKRIPKTAIPEGLVRGISKIFLVHKKAILKTTKGTLQDLAYTLVDENVMTYVELHNLVDLEMPFWTGAELQPMDPVPASMLDIAYAFSRLPAARQQRLIEEFGIEFFPGIFGYAPLTSLQYVVKKGEDGLPEDLAHLGGYVEPVRVIYEDGENEIAEEEI